MNIPDLLKGSPLFYEIHDREIEAILKKCEICEYSKDSYIFQSGWVSDHLFMLLEGRVSLMKTTDTTSVQIDELEAGDLFGVDVLSDEKSTSVDAHCTENCFVLKINYDLLRSLYQKKPALLSLMLLNISRLLARRVVNAREKICGIAELTHFTRSDPGFINLPDKPLVYVLEDDEDIRDIAEQYLKDKFRVEVFETPMPVLNLLEKGAVPDIFITDFMMPEMNGIEFTGYLKESNIDRPVIFISGVNQFDMAMDALNLGVHSLLEKPFTGEQLVQTVQNALREKILVEFNNDLLTQYKSLFTSLSDILKSLNSEDFSERLKVLFEESQENYVKMALKKKTLNLLD